MTEILEITSKNEIVDYLHNNKAFFYDRFGVTSIGLFGSFIRDQQSHLSDIDMVIEFEKGRKNLHSFLEFRRFLEEALSRKVDLGVENALKPILRDSIKGKIIYV